MIKALVWNIRGIVNGPSIRKLTKLLASYEVDCFAIFEPKCSKGTIKDYEKNFNCLKSVSNKEGNIWVFWKSTFLA